MKKQIILVGGLIWSASNFAQIAPTGTPPNNNTNAQAGAAWYRGGNFNTNPTNNNIFGTMWDSPIYTYTNGVQRMVVNGNVPLREGFIGIGTSNPQFRLHVDGAGTGNATAQGWTKALLLSNDGALMWQGSPSPNNTTSTPWNYFMAHASNNPVGDFYQGMSNGIGSTAPVVYASKVFVGSNTTGVPQGSTQVFKNFLVADEFNTNTSAFVERSMGINTTRPNRTLDIVDVGGNVGDAQLRLTRTYNVNPNLGVRTDFRTTTQGNLAIFPKNDADTGFVGIAVNSLRERIDVAGNARLRSVQTQTAQYIMTGVQQGTNANDIVFSKLAFSGNANQVLLGNGTWGAAPSVSSAHNGLFISTIDPTRIALGQDIAQPNNPAQLLNDREVPLNTHVLRFSTTSAGQAGQVVIGNYGGPISGTRFIVENDVYATGQVVRTYSSNSTYIPSRTGIYSEASTADAVVGVYGNVTDATKFAVGIRGRANSGLNLTQNAGGFFEGIGATQSKENNGVRGYASNSIKVNIGGKFKADSPNNANFPLNIGVYAEGIGANSYAAYLVGSTVTTGSSLWLSDSTYKDNIQTIGASVDTLFNSLNPVSFVFNQAAQARLNTGSNQKVGFLAQQIEAIYPWMVQDVVLPAEYDTLGVEIHPESTYKAVDVTQLIPVIVSDAQRKNVEIKQLNLINATQDSIINDLNTRLTTLENCLSGILPFLCQLSNSSIQQNDEQTQQNIIKELKVQLDNSQSIVLGQNVPNPFAEQTVIEYYIPEAVKQAQIIFYNQTGQIINTVNIEEMGNGRLTVFANDLSSGIYTYTLVADGQVIATKKMVKTK